ncbi:hypothetical protein DN402_34145 [Streptomyces sp. SW4]|nr:hypothetical protein DN402_34145 [Streptomyces sp. SW4]
MPQAGQPRQQARWPRLPLRGEDTNWWLAPGERLSWSFDLRIDKASELKPGKVSLRVRPEGNSDPENDTAVIDVTLPATAVRTGNGSPATDGTTDRGADWLPWTAGAASLLALSTGAALLTTRRRRRP